MFELTILFSALATVKLMFLFNGLPQLYHPLFTSNRFRRASNDRFFIVIEARDPKFLPKRTEEFLKTLSPVSIETVED
jgi:CRISPR/Cas system endoribonuclease Cas6 (RAMP superfamily)